MRILLINPVRQRILSWREQEILFMPLGLGYIAAVLRNNGHTVKIVERRFFYKADYWDNKSMEEINYSTKRAILDFAPDLVGVTASTPQIMDAFRTVKLVKEINPNIITLIGGCHVTAHPEFSLKQCSQLDIVCQGEGEVTTLEIANGVPLDKIGGIIYRKNGKIVSNAKRKFIGNLDTLPFPARDLFDTKFYFSNSRAIIRGIFLRSTTIYTSRGCPFKCSFCQSPQLATACNGKYFRANSPDYIIKEIQHLHDNYNIGGIMILDDMFSLDKNRAISICEKLIETGLSKKIKYIAQTRIDSVDDKFMQALKDSGCFQLILGCESGSNETLKRMQKKLTVEQSLNTIKLAHKYNVNSSVNILIGTIGETEGGFLKTIQFLKKARPDCINMAKYFPLPGSIDYINLTKKNILKSEYENWDEICEKYVESDFTFADISPERFKKLTNKLKKEIYIYRNYLFEVKNNINVDFSIVVTKFIFIFLHIAFLYLPISCQDWFKKIFTKINYKLRYLFRDKMIKENA